MKRRTRLMLYLAAFLALSLSLADELRNGRPEAPLDDILPSLPEYRTLEGETITGYVAGLGEGAALLAGQPQLAVAIGMIDHVTSCYQEVGGVGGRAYSHRERPLEAGIVAVVDAQRMSDPELLFRCVAPAALPLENQYEPVLQPCTGAYTLQRDHTAFHIVYAGSTVDVCRDFCAGLEGCAIHPEPVALPLDS